MADVTCTVVRREATERKVLSIGEEATSPAIAEGHGQNESGQGNRKVIRPKGNGGISRVGVGLSFPGIGLTTNGGEAISESP